MRQCIEILFPYTILGNLIYEAMWRYCAVFFYRWPGFDYFGLSAGFNR